MSERPWLTIIGLGEDGPEGLSPASLSALEAAEIVMGPSRHLALLTTEPAKTVEWPVPFADGIARLLELRGQHVAVLASGDPFWFGAGSVLARHLDSAEWTSLPAQSCFSLAANRLGWPLETTSCFGLHAAPLTRLRPHLAEGARMIVTLRDGEAAALLATYLCEQGFGDSSLHIMEALGGPRENVSQHAAKSLPNDVRFSHPLSVAIELQGSAASMPQASGIPDSWFENDGQITKRPVRALTLSALAPRRGEHLWDIGGGSGSIAIEWLLTHSSVQATSIEANAERAARIARNAQRLGVDRLRIVNGTVPDALRDLEAPDVVFIGGGLSTELLTAVADLAKGTRIVANAVTLESEILLTEAQSRLGGDLLRIELSEAIPLGSKRGWSAAYPIVQWSVTL